MPKVVNQSVMAIRIVATADGWKLIDQFGREQGAGTN
jgi:hypothetical protein